MTRMDGRFIKPGSIPADRLDPEIIFGDGGVPNESVTAEKLAAALLERFVIVSWGSPGLIDPTTRTVSLQLKNLLANNISSSHVLRITCDDRASIAVGAEGVALSGDDTSDLIAQTSGAGQLDLIVTCNQTITVSLAAGPTQLSPILDCRSGIDVSFT